MRFSIKYKYISPSILEIYWPAEISRSILLDMMALKNSILSLWQKQLWDVNIGYHCLSLHFKAPYSLEETIKELDLLYQENEELPEVKRKRWTIPVLYNGKDLERVSEITHQSVEDIISLHQSPSYLLYFYGFMPGFMYLGGLSDKIYAPRKAKPDPIIHAGSVAIGGKQTGIYPMDSPGGWNIIGNTPVPLFELKQTPPITAQPGDEIRFKAINKTEFETILKKVNSNNYKLAYETL
ncbi:5-oxoprolinase subunit PxpB [Echinicola sediminis]